MTAFFTFFFALIYRVAKRPWDLALLCMAEQQMEAAIPHFSELASGVFPPQAGSLELELLELITPFFPYHEAAHLLLNHSSDRSAEKEMKADSLAFALFLASRGWRDETEGALGFGEVGSTLLGPIVFLWVVTYFTRLELLTASKRELIAAKQLLEELALRRQNLATRVQATIELSKIADARYTSGQKFSTSGGTCANTFIRSELVTQSAALSDLVALSTRALDTWSEIL